jgi:hypothetical protein
MTKKIFLFFISLIFLSNCGFAPIYKNMMNIKFNISITEMNGNREMNNLINSNLKRYSNISDAKNFNISISTNYKRAIIAKDNKGKITDYRIKVASTFKIKLEDYSQTITISESFDYKNIENSFDLLKYEETVKENIASITVQKLISQLTRIE